MRSGFEEYFDLSEADLKKLWQNAVFVFDTNAFLSLFRDKKSTSDDLMRIIKSLGDRVWVPHQVAAEFHRNRAGVIIGNKKLYQPLRNAVEVARAEADKYVKKSIDGFKHHPVMSVSEAISYIGGKFDEIIKDIDKKERGGPQEDHYKIVFEQLVQSLEKMTGIGYEGEELAKLLKDGKERCESMIPPGYIDFKEKEDMPIEHRLGDYIIWRQMIDYSIKVNKHIIFVTDDVKEDWWREVKGEKIGPRLELIREFLDKTTHRFYVYTRYRFLERAREFLDLEVSNRTLDDVKVTTQISSKSNQEKPSLFQSKDILDYDEISKFMFSRGKYMEHTKQYRENTEGTDILNKLKYYSLIEVLEKSKLKIERDLRSCSEIRKDAIKNNDFSGSRATTRKLIELTRDLEKTVSELANARAKAGISYIEDEDDEDMNIDS